MAIAARENNGDQTTPKSIAVRRPAPKPKKLAPMRVNANAQGAQPQATSSPSHRTRPIELPEKSHQAARKLFKKFNLSKFADGGTPSNYIPTEKTPEGAHHVASVKQVREFQMKALEHHLRNISKMETPNRGFTLALSEEARKKLFPSFNVKTGTVDLKDVIDLIERNMRGTEFFNKGNPVLNRLALRARAQEILAGKGKAKK